MIPVPRKSDSLDPLVAALDDATHGERVAWARKLGKRDMTALWRLTEGRPVRLDELHGKEGEVVVHEGQNSLPAFNVFQKRVVLRDGVVQGYNEQWTSFATGPGHFLCRDEGTGAYFDYREVAASAPGEFPPIASNDRWIAALVYGGMVDHLRRVSKHTIVGKAERKGITLGEQYFVLVRP